MTTLIKKLCAVAIGTCAVSGITEPALAQLSVPQVYAQIKDMRSRAPVWRYLSASALVAILFWMLPVAQDVSPAVTASAYNPSTHRQLVLDAIDYINEQGTPTQKAALRKLIQEAGSEEEVRRLLGNEAYNTDYYQDTYFYSNSYTVGTFIGRVATHIETSYFTRLNHFVNVRRESRLWREREGYYYPWSSQADEDSESMASDLVSFLDVEVDNDLSLFLERYRPHFKSTNDQWSRNWEYDWSTFGDDWDIANTRFTPVSALAQYWFRRYVNFPHEPAWTGIDFVYTNSTVGGTTQTTTTIVPSGISRGIQLLGPALHACGDVTVPQHGLGTSGLGHVQYEDWFQEIYQAYGDIRRDNALIQQHLNRDFLRIPRASVPSEVQTLQVTLVTGDLDQAGTDADIFLDVGATRSWELDTGLDDFERAHDDVFTLPAQGVRLEDFQRIRVRHEGNGGEWHLKAIYLVANGVLVYGNDHVNTWLRRGQNWTIHFHPPASLTQQVWPIDTVLERAAEYGVTYMQTAGGAANPWDRPFWDREFFSAANWGAEGRPDRGRQNMRHLLNLAIALIVRTIEMSQLERGLIVPAVPIGPGPIGPRQTGRMSQPLTTRPIQTTKSRLPAQEALQTRPATALVSTHLASRLTLAQRQATEVSLTRIRRTLGTRGGQPLAAIVASLAQEEEALAKILVPTVEYRRLPTRQKVKEPKPEARGIVPVSADQKQALERQGRYRRPTAEEVKNPALVERYFREAREFEKQQHLATLTLARAAGKAMLTKVSDPSDRARLERKLRAWEERRNRLLARP